MSVRAHRIIEIKTEQESTFNLSHDQKLKDFLDEQVSFYFDLNPHGTGIAEIPVEVLSKAIRMAAELNIDEKTVKLLKRDIASAKVNKDEYVDYFCI